jgi:hypothetical protein
MWRLYVIHFACPYCKTVHRVDDQAAGTVTTCATCGRQMRLPQATTPSTALPVIPVRPAANPGAPGPSPPPLPTAVGRREDVDSEPPLVLAADDAVAANQGPPQVAEIPDEDESSLRAELPPQYPPEAEQLGRPRFRVERPTLPADPYRPAFIAFLCCIPGTLCIVAGPLFPRFMGLVWVGGWVGFAVWWIARQLRKTKVQAVVYTGGFVLYDGRRFTVWHWDDVAKLNMQNCDFHIYNFFVQVNRFLATFYRLRQRDGTEYRFWSTQGPRAAQFGSLVQNETHARLLPAALARLQAGESVDFGPFRMEPTGLAFHGHSVPWSEVGGITVKQGKLLIDGVGANGTTATVRLDVVDNCHVLLSLLDQKLGGRMGERKARPG